MTSASTASSVVDEPDVVAVIGAGPAGLVALKTLLEVGLRAIAFEAESGVGGLWNLDAERSSCIWEGMSMNGWKVCCSFSDHFFDEGVPPIPSAEQFREYLEGYADKFDLSPSIRFGQTVVLVSRDEDGGGGGYVVRCRSSTDGTESARRFRRVVVCSSRMSPRHPNVPTDVPGLETFPPNEVRHSVTYRGAAPWKRYEGKRVLVVGGKVSGPEIAMSLANRGVDVDVRLSTRVNKYFYTPEDADGRPVEPRFLNRLTALLAELAPSKEFLSDYVRDGLVRVCGHPEKDWHVWQVPDDFFRSSTMSSQGFPEAAGSGIVGVRPGIRRVDGNDVTYDDGTSERVDAVVLATGMRHGCSYLDERIQETVRYDRTWLRLYKSLFHPDLPGLAFVGSAFLLGSVLPGLEVDAMCVALHFKGSLDNLPDEEEMRREMDAVDESRSSPDNPSYAPFHELACHHSEKLARLAGVNPVVSNHPEIAKALVLGPAIAASYRLDGPFRTEGAKENFLEQLRQMDGAEELLDDGVVPSEVALLREIASKADEWEPGLKPLLDSWRVA